LPGYNPTQSLAKDSNLALTAVSYKINLAGIDAAVRTELSKKREAKVEGKTPNASATTGARRHKPAKTKATK